VSSRLFNNIPKSKDIRTQSQATDRKNQRLLTEEAPIGKIYVELENKKIVVLNIKEHEDPSTIATRFLSTYSVRRDHYKAVVDHIRAIRDHWKEHPESEDCVVKNLVLKDSKVQMSARKPVTRENQSASKSPMRSKGITLTTARHQTPGRGQIETTGKVLFKLNFEIGHGKTAKLIFKQGESAFK